MAGLKFLYDERIGLQVFPKDRRDLQCVHNDGEREKGHQYRAGGPFCVATIT